MDDRETRMAREAIEGMLRVTVDLADGLTGVAVMAKLGIEALEGIERDLLALHDIIGE